MLTNREPDWNIDDLTDTEIYDAICYLEPAPTTAAEQDSGDQDQGDGVVICVCLYIALGGLLGLPVVLLEMMRFCGRAKKMRLIADLWTGEHLRTSGHLRLAVTLVALNTFNRFVTRMTHELR